CALGTTAVSSVLRESHSKVLPKLPRILTTHSNGLTVSQESHDPPRPQSLHRIHPSARDDRAPMYAEKLGGRQLLLPSLHRHRNKFRRSVFQHNFRVIVPRQDAHHLIQLHKARSCRDRQSDHARARALNGTRRSTQFARHPVERKSQSFSFHGFQQIVCCFHLKRSNSKLRVGGHKDDRHVSHPFNEGETIPPWHLNVHEGHIHLPLGCKTQSLLHIASNAAHLDAPRVEQ